MHPPQIVGHGVLQVNDIEVRYMPPADCMLSRGLRYLDVFGLLPLVHGLFHTSQGALDPVNLLIKGNTGQGKSLLAAYWAETSRIPYISFPCSVDTTDRHLRGGFLVKNDRSTPFVMGVMANALQVANETGMCMLVLEEANNLRPQQQKHINSLTDFQRALTLPEIPWALALEPHARLIVIATSTDAGFAFKYNEDLKTRFRELELGYPELEDELVILKEMAPPGIPLEEGQLRSLIRIAQQTRQSAGFAHQLSTRELVACLQDIGRVGWEETLFLLGQKFTLEERELFMQRVRDITSLTIPLTLAERLSRIRGVRR